MPMTTTGLFAGSRIEARYNQGTPMEVKRSYCWYPGIVKRVHGGGAFGSTSYDVRFDDGVNEDGIPAEHIRKEGSGDGDDVLPGLGGPDMPAPALRLRESGLGRAARSLGRAATMSNMGVGVRNTSAARSTRTRPARAT